MSWRMSRVHHSQLRLAPGGMLWSFGFFVLAFLSSEIVIWFWSIIPLWYVARFSLGKHYRSRWWFVWPDSSTIVRVCFFSSLTTIHKHGRNVYLAKVIQSQLSFINYFWLNSYSELCRNKSIQTKWSPFEHRLMFIDRTACLINNRKLALTNPQFMLSKAKPQP